VTMASSRTSAVACRTPGTVTDRNDRHAPAPSTEPYLLTGGGGPDGASTTPVLLMYQQGIQQGKPDTASAIGVVLVILVLIVALINRRLTERSER